MCKGKALKPKYIFLIDSFSVQRALFTFYYITHKPLFICEMFKRDNISMRKFFLHKYPVLNALHELVNILTNSVIRKSPLSTQITNWNHMWRNTVGYRHFLPD